MNTPFSFSTSRQRNTKRTILTPASRIIPKSSSIVPIIVSSDSMHPKKVSGVSSHALPTGSQTLTTVPASRIFRPSSDTATATSWMPGTTKSSGNSMVLFASGTSVTTCVSRRSKGDSSRRWRTATATVRSRSELFVKVQENGPAAAAGATGRNRPTSAISTLIPSPSALGRAKFPTKSSSSTPTAASSMLLPITSSPPKEIGLPGETDGPSPPK